jgi:HAD superfamily hydrolase (TIGR01490 family)
LSLAIFDLDNTLIAGDSDYLWGKFLTEKGLVDADFYEQENQRFYDEYKKGTLDIYEFLSFSLEPLSRYDMETLDELHRDFMQQMIEPIMLPRGKELIEKHRNAGDILMIITATNRFVTAPIARSLNIEHLLATEPEIAEGRYTGGVTDIPCYKEGKVERLENWLEKNQVALENSWFYSDSHNDLPLLGKVTHPVAVDPDSILEAHARVHSWPIISLRDNATF